MAKIKVSHRHKELRLVASCLSTQGCTIGLELYGSMPYNFSQQGDITMAALTARLEARISTDLQTMLKRAAELQGRTVTDFVVSTVQEAARKTIQQAEVLSLSVADQECFAKALLSPPKPNAALKRAFKRRTKLIAVE